MKKAIYLAILTIVTIVAILVGISIHMGGFALDIFHVARWFGNDTSADSITSNTDLDEFDSIYMDIDALEVNVTVGDKYAMTYEGAENFRPEVDVCEGTLSVNQKSKGSSLNRSGKVTITVPEGAVLDTVEMNIAAGDIDIDSIVAKSYTLDISAGDVDISGGKLETIKLDCAAGDVDISKCEFNDLTANLSAGDFDLKVTDKIKDYEIDAEASLGTVEIANHDEDDSYEQGGSGTKYIKVDVSMGSVNINE